MLPRVITCCAVLLDVTKSYYIFSSVVACYLELLYAAQCFEMLPTVITCYAGLLHVTKGYYMLCSVVTCYQELLHVCAVLLMLLHVLPRVIT